MARNSSVAISSGIGFSWIMYVHQVVFLNWWFGTWLLFSHILGIIIPFDFHIFQRGSNHQLPVLIFSGHLRLYADLLSDHYQRKYLSSGPHSIEIVQPICNRFDNSFSKFTVPPTPVPTETGTWFQKKICTMITLIKVERDTQIYIPIFSYGTIPPRIQWLSTGYVSPYMLIVVCKLVWSSLYWQYWLSLPLSLYIDIYIYIYICSYILYIYMDIHIYIYIYRHIYINRTGFINIPIESGHSSIPLWTFHTTSKISAAWPMPKARGWSSFEWIRRFFRREDGFRGALEKVSRASIVAWRIPSTVLFWLGKTGTMLKW